MAELHASLSDDATNAEAKEILWLFRSERDRNRFFVFAAVAFAAGITVVLFAVEATNKTLEEISH